MVNNQELINRIVKLIKDSKVKIEFKNNKLTVDNKEYKIPKESNVKKRDINTFR